jgi:hypothetical protein
MAIPINVGKQHNNAYTQDEAQNFAQRILIHDEMFLIR